LTKANATRAEAVLRTALRNILRELEENEFADENEGGAIFYLVSKKSINLALAKSAAGPTSSDLSEDEDPEDATDCEDSFAAFFASID
jgi:hypothetical protein